MNEVSESATVASIRQRLELAFQPQQLIVEDESWKHSGHAGVREHGGGHYVITIAAKPLSDQPRRQAHRLIYRALDDLFPRQIHALSICIQTPKG